MEQQLQEEEKATGRILTRSPIKSEFVTSQRDYIPTPFRMSAWEVVGERLENLNFIPLEVSVIPSNAAAPDPMFEDFGNVIGSERRSVHHTQDGSYVDYSKADVEEAPSIDPAVLEAELQRAFEEGRAQGMEEGKEQTTALIAERYEELQARFQQFQEQVQQQISAFIQNTENNALNLALSVSKKILHTTAEAKPEYIFEVIRQGVRSLGAAKPLRIRLSNQDYEFIQVIGAPADIDEKELGFVFVPDETVASGCIIETDFGDVDLQLDTMWEQVRESLFGVRR